MIQKIIVIKIPNNNNEGGPSNCITTTGGSVFCDKKKERKCGVGTIFAGKRTFAFGRT